MGLSSEIGRCAAVQELQGVKCKAVQRGLDVQKAFKKPLQ